MIPVDAWGTDHIEVIALFLGYSCLDPKVAYLTEILDWQGLTGLRLFHNKLN